MLVQHVGARFTRPFFMQGTSEVIFTDPGHGTWLVLVGTLLLASCLQQKYTLVLLLHAHTTVGHT